MAELYKEDTVEQRILLSASAFALYLYKPHDCNHSIHSFSLTHEQHIIPNYVCVYQTNKYTMLLFTPRTIEISSDLCFLQKLKHSLRIQA